jgi:hypothetical protein
MFVAPSLRELRVRLITSVSSVGGVIGGGAGKFANYLSPNAAHVVDGDLENGTFVNDEDRSSDRSVRFTRQNARGSSRNSIRGSNRVGTSSRHTNSIPKYDHAGDHTNNNAHLNANRPWFARFQIPENFYASGLNFPQQKKRFHDNYWVNSLGNYWAPSIGTAGGSSNNGVYDVLPSSPSAP